ncbi:ribonucleotide reductase of class III (anaerobic), activating protein [Vibrio phage JSF12]|uniref:Anaerobic ribonucleoside-triphosphate reductase-activating protein n=3 Tax=Jesfedecavirus TaxID=2560156 RepID=A0A2D0YLR2_9CAUD|nr:anaerobic ribonucleotide reductase small subunit [Vibrio phage phi 3]YP_009618447.1 anaerobic ribonucleotide reductase small subunit [Vibrio phage JSF10]YP_009794692.1 anaerobic ribonucleotide reductase small subunit [Vibrio phage JSF12]AJF40854.1 hypothetical protein SBVP3_0087 [Vibrio phage phi 3]ASV43420.1 ribonucleotide reductase of class III (anaerobic), activating protein [Vibrio phage JSF10]ASV43527.1 ribonucleotide reductase of class III (anaerobic), activating protein [Vibrio phage
MNYLKYLPIDVVNGKGTRCVLFVSGCSHGCKGCYNQSSWNPSSGFPFTKELEDKIISDLLDTKVPRKGITLSGGDPLHKRNFASVLRLCKRIKSECPTKDIWLYTGYTFEEVLDSNFREILDYVDVLVDGRYEESLRDPSLAFRGSSNQRIIYLEKQH